MTAELSTAKKAVIVLVLFLICFTALIYEMLHPTLFPLLKHAVVNLLSSFDVFSGKYNMAFLNSPTFSL